MRFQLSVLLICTVTCWKNHLKYLIIFRLQEADLGFHLIIDRRNDKWNSVKTVLLKISVSIYIYNKTYNDNIRKSFDSSVSNYLIF